MKNNDNHKCEICHKEFSEIELLKCHFLRMHLGLEAKHKCEICERLFVRPSDLKNHMHTHQNVKSVHESETFQCNTCEKTFSGPQYLKVHIKRVHTKNIKYVWA